jgi:uncharacterized protein
LGKGKRKGTGKETNYARGLMNKKWHAEGLHFACTGCGKCCTGPGYVWVNEEEVAEMAAFLGITAQEFKKLYTRQVGKRLTLTERRPNFDCVFLEGKQCRIYAARPTQCRTYPFWPQNLQSKEAWEETARVCEGIDCKAPLVPEEEIAAQELIQIGRNKQN